MSLLSPAADLQQCPLPFLLHVFDSVAWPIKSMPDRNTEYSVVMDGSVKTVSRPLRLSGSPDWNQLVFLSMLFFDDSVRILWLIRANELEAPGLPLPASSAAQLLRRFRRLNSYVHQIRSHFPIPSSAVDESVRRLHFVHYTP